MAETGSKLESKRYVKITIIAAVVVLSAVLVIRFSDDIFGDPSPYLGVGKPGSDHQHAVFMVWLDGQRVSFSPVLYPDEYLEKNLYMLIEIDHGWKIHRFASGATLDIFFESVGMKFSKDCFIIPEGTKDVHHNDIERTEFCNEGDKTLKFYVNDKLNDDFEKYVLWDENRILITYGNETQEKIDKQLKQLLRGRGPPIVIP